MREEQVENGVNFLIHPKAKTAPLSQRISFLENKGLTPEEISAALSRVEAGTESSPSATAGRDTGTSSQPGTLSSTSSPFPSDASIPLWRQVAVPGALAMGAVGALGAYYATSRSAARGGQNASGDSSHAAAAAAAAAGRIPYPSGDAVVAATPAEAAGFPGRGLSEPIGVEATGGDRAFGEGAFAQEQLEGGFAQPPFDGGTGGDGSFPRTGAGERAPGAAGEPSSLLAVEFRRLTETMEQQTGQLVEAVGAMKALASRAEEDSSSLLAARVSNHTSELRAELETIKQLLLLQARGEGSGGTAAAGVQNNSGVVMAASVAGDKAGHASATTCPKAAFDEAKDNSLRNGGVTSGGAEGMNRAVDQQVNGLEANSRLPTKDLEKDKAKGLEKQKAKEAADKAAAEAAALAASERRKDTARAALAAILADNTPQAAKDGIAMLRMLVVNLINQPNVPRYRRITTSNDNFKKRLLPLEGHRAMMEAVGFKAKANLWEWTWHEESAPSDSSNNKAVLEDVVKAIDTVARPNGPPLSSATPTAPITVASTSASASLTSPATVTPGSAKKPTDGNGNAAAAAAAAAAAVASETNVVARRSRSPQAAPVGAAASDRAVETSDGNTSNAGAGAGAGVVQPSGGRKDVLAAAAEVNGVGENSGETARLSEGVEQAVVAAAAKTQAVGTVGTEQNSRGVEAVAVEQKVPPATMAEVASALQRGDEPPGIRVVEDRLSADAPSLEVSSHPSPPKPWEVLGVRSSSAHEDVEGGTGAGVVGGNGGGRGYRGREDGRSRPQHAVSVGP